MYSGVVAATFPSVFKGGARGIKSLEAEGGVVSKGRVASLYMLAQRTLFLF